MKTLLHYLVLGLMITTLSSCIGKVDVTFQDLLKSSITQPPIMSAANVSVAEEAASGSFTVTLDKAYTVPVTVDYTTSSLTAVQFEDYIGALPSGTLTFAPGEVSKNISVTLKDDALPENPKDVILTLGNPSVGPHTTAVAKMTITDTDSNFFGADIATLNATTGPTHAPTYSFTTTNTITVDPLGGADYTTIQAAINAAIPGTQILVNSGVFPEALSLNSLGTSAGNPIVIKAGPGQTPVVTGAEIISPGAVVNDNTDGEETGSNSFGFEGGALDGFNFYDDTNHSNTITNVTGAGNFYQGTHGLKLTFNGSESQAQIYSPFRSNYVVNAINGLDGSEYRARFMFKLSSDFALDAVPSTTKSIVFMRAEEEGNTDSPFNIELYLKTNPNQFMIKLYKKTSSLGGNTNFNRNTWNQVDFYYKKASSVAANDGVVKMYVNGVQTISVNHNVTANHDRFRLGSIVSVAAGNCPTSAASNACVSAGSILFDSIRLEEGNTLPRALPSVSDSIVRTIYENGFETDLTAFTAAAGGSNSATVSTTTPYEGSQSGKMIFGGSSAENYLQKTFTDASSDIFARVNFRLNSNFNLTEEAAKVPGTSEYTREFDLISLYGASGATGRLKVSLLKRGTRFFLLGKILSANNTAGTPLSWATELDIENYLQIYKGHAGEIDRGVWNNLEIRYAGGKTLKAGVEIWLNGVSLGSNINRTTGKYEGLLTDGLLVDTVQLGTLADNNTSGSPAVSMQTTAPTAGSTIEFDGLKVTTGGPAGYSATGVTPVVYRYPYTTPGVNEDIPKNLTIDGNVLTPVTALSQIGPGTFFLNTVKKLVYFRLVGDVPFTTQAIFSGRRNYVLNMTDSSNVVLQGLQFRNGNNDNIGCLQIVNSKAIRIVGNLFKGCSGPGINVADQWNAITRSSDLLISGNTFADNAKPATGNIFINQAGNIKIENNLIRSGTANGVVISCAYDDSGSYNLTTSFCSDYRIARNIFSQSMNNSIFLNGNAHGARIYSNQISNSREAGYLTQTTGGAWINSGGSTIQLARAAYGNYIYNNLIDNADRTGILLRAAARNNYLFNNTIAEMGVNIPLGGSAVDFHANAGELNPDHRNPTANNFAYNNIYSLTYGSNSCVNLDGNTGSDQSNMTNNNIFYSCGNAGEYNSTNYSTLASFVSGIGTTYGARENNSQGFSGVLYDPGTFDFSLDGGASFTATPYDVRAFMP